MQTDRTQNKGFTTQDSAGNIDTSIANKISAGITPIGTDTAVWAAAQWRFGFTGTAQGTWNGTFMLRQNALVSPTAYESGALFIKAVTADDDTTHVGRDVVGFDSDGETTGTTSFARIWGGVIRFAINTGADGQGIGLETDLTNNGADQSLMPDGSGVYNAKVGYWLASAGSNPSSAYIATAVGGPGAHYGVNIRNIASGGFAFVAPNNVPYAARNAANTAELKVLWLDGSNVVQIGTSSATAVQTNLPTHLDGGCIAANLTLNGGTTLTGQIGTGTSVLTNVGPSADKLTLTAAAPTVSAGQVGLGSTTATSATAGTNGAVPAQVAGYIIANVGGTTVKIPYYSN